MSLSISQEEKEVLDDLKQAVVKLNQELFQLSIGLLLSIKQIILTWIIGLSDFAPSEIKKHGIEAILIKRALRFFGMELSEKSSTIKTSLKKGRREGTKFTIRVTAKRITKLILFPLYVIILLILKFKPQKNVKNNFKN